ncbi:thermonuclease family protein [Methylococcus mesophilus]|uniref:thermonuclease family protein n=1 Tax=Methylococcus mesophilus TaxID=2993564 RepID=UPI00224A865B|nr:thermonuclease family protein [Methylococcus mesophilus]UZR30739.1 thermonuclease family protein [Methylococcus mesophilus]
MRFLFLWLCLTVTASAAAESLAGRVVSVLDGDTITLLSVGNVQTRVRLAQIDAPEKRQDYGQASKRALSDWVSGKKVTVEVADTDRYGRSVGKVLIGGTDVNLEQVRAGMAWVYRKYAYDPGYFSAEDEARAVRRGLWSQPNPVPPWEFRHKSRGPSFWDDFNPTRKPTQTPRPLSGVAASACGSKRTCQEMTTCDEARYYLTRCGVKSLDRDGDGVPCEGLCGG